MIEKFHIQLMPQGYQSKIADDIAGNLLSNSYLAPGTQNVLIGDDGCVQSRKGYELLGQAGGYGSVVWSDTWRTGTNQERAMRTIFDTFQVYYNGQWRDVKSGFGNNTNFCGNSWFDKTESMSKYIFVNGTTKIYSWQGGIAEVASRVSGSSLKKTNGATPTLKQILIPAGGASISWGYPTVAQNEVTINAIKGQDVPHNFWDEFFRAGDTIDITIAAIAGTYTIASVDRDNNEILITGSFPSVGTSSTVGEGIIGTVNAYGPISKTFAQERFHTQNNLRFVMMGVVYTYTGGFNSDTLTGITPTLPAVIPDGTIIYSDIIETTPTGNDYPTGATPDILSVAKNQAYIAQSTRNWVWLSKQDDYTSYTYTTPLRIFGEGGGVRLDNNIRAIVTNQEGTVEVSAEDVWYPITLVSVTTSGIPGEEVRVGVPKSGAGIGANNQFSVANTRNGIIFLSNEPTLEYLVNTLQTIATPLSDPIKTDFQNWNMDGVKCLYWKSYLWVLIPQESILIGYDLIRNFWQPPQIIAGNTLSIIEGWLVVHSSSQNESYRMFVGTNDNGNPFIQRSVYTYREGSSRAEYQVSGGYFVEAKVTAQTDEIRFVCQTGYKGSVDKFEYTFGSQDGNPYVDTPLNTPGFGGVGFGERPFGSFFTTDDEVQYRKVRRIFPITKNSEFFEMQVYFECDKLDAQFKIVSHGEQMLPSGSHNSELIKI